MSFTISVKGVSQTFNKLIETYKDIVTSKAELTVNNLLLELESATPVDTGKAKASWLYTRAISKDSFLIKNTVPYIQYLNAGTSKQAPSHFIENIALKYGKPVGTIVTQLPE